MINYRKIVAPKYFTAIDAFCDENGNLKTDFPSMDWNVEFQKTSGGTKVQIEITFASEKDLNTIVEMGFEQGFAMAHDNLDEIFKNSAIPWVKF